MQETTVRSLDWEEPLEKGMTTHSSILAWRIPWTEDPGGLQSLGSQTVKHNWVINTFADCRGWPSPSLNCLFLFLFSPEQEAYGRTYVIELINVYFLDWYQLPPTPETSRHYEMSAKLTWQVEITVSLQPRENTVLFNGLINTKNGIECWETDSLKLLNSTQKYKVRPSCILLLVGSSEEWFTALYLRIT